MLRVPSPFGIGSPFGQLRAFDPASLFAGGIAGAWYDPSDLSTLFQDAAGTTPVTASGQPVGLMLDKSGNGNHATQAIYAKRPIYTEGSGLSWLAFDGVGDFMSHSNHPFTYTGAFTCAVGFSKTGSFNRFETLYSAGAKGNGDANGGKTMTFMLGDDPAMGANRPHLATDIWAPSGVAGSSTLTAAQDSVAVWKSGNWSTHRSGSNTKIRLDGSEEIVSSYNDVDPISLNDGPAYLGVFDPLALNSSFYQGKMYGIVIIKEDLGESNLSKLETHLAAKSGVTL